MTTERECPSCKYWMRRSDAARRNVRRSNSIAFAMTLAAVAGVLFGLLMLNAIPSASAATKRKPIRWQSTTATWYGPGGLYGNTTACGQRYGNPDGTKVPRGVAIGRTRDGRWLARCGDRFVIRYRGRTVRVRVIDRCPGCVGEGHRFDLSARTAFDLCRCWRPYTMRVRWRQVPR